MFAVTAAHFIIRYMVSSMSLQCNTGSQDAGNGGMFEACLESNIPLVFAYTCHKRFIT